MRKLLTTGMTLALLSGCATATKEDFNTSINAYIGGPVENLITTIGQPETTHETPSGYDYVFRNEVTATGLLSTSGTYCTLNVHLDKDNIITKIDQSGRQEMSMADEGDECAWAYQGKLPPK